MTKYNSGGRLTPAQRTTKPFVDEIYVNYLERHSEKEDGADEAIKSYLHTMVLSVHTTMSVLRDPNYKRIFDLLDVEDQRQFYKAAFSAANQGCSSFGAETLPCCLVRDSYHGDFSKIEQGGDAAEILLSISRANKEDSPRSVALAEEWGIDDRIARNLYERGINMTMASQIALSSIESLNFPEKFNPELLGSLFRETLPRIEQEFRIKLGMDSILKQEGSEREASWVGRVSKSVSFVESTK